MSEYFVQQYGTERYHIEIFGDYVLLLLNVALFLNVGNILSKPILFQIRNFHICWIFIQVLKERAASSWLTLVSTWSSRRFLPECPAIFLFTFPGPSHLTSQLLHILIQNQFLPNITSIYIAKHLHKHRWPGQQICCITSTEQSACNDTSAKVL